VKGINELIVKWWPKDLEVCVPLGASEKDDVVFVNLSNSGDDVAIKWFELRVQVNGIEIMRYGLVE